MTPQKTVLPFFSCHPTFVTQAFQSPIPKLVQSHMDLDFENDCNQPADSDFHPATSPIVSDITATSEQPEDSTMPVSVHQEAAVTLLPRKPGRAKVYRLEKGLLMKESPWTRSSESAAMQYIRDYTPSVPVPTVYLTDFSNTKGTIFMEEISGSDLEVIWPRLSHSQKSQACLETWNLIKALRKIPKPKDLPSTAAFYTTVDGSPMHPHYALLGKSDEPLPKEVLKNDDALRNFILQRYRKFGGSDKSVKSDFPRSKAAVFTHGDIQPKNIMVSKEGHVLSLIDWEAAGFMPD